MRLIGRYLVFSVFLLTSCVNHAEVKTDSNPFFFCTEDTIVVYEGFFNSGNEIENHDFRLNIIQMHSLDFGNLYALILDQIYTTDPFDEIPADRRHLGYFFITPTTIYRSFAPVLDYLTTEWSVVAHVDGHDASDDDWNQYVEVYGNQLIFRSYSNSEGTTFYERIVWEKGRGIVHYLSGFGSMRDHLEFWIP